MVVPRVPLLIQIKKVCGLIVSFAHHILNTSLHAKWIEKYAMGIAQYLEFCFFKISGYVFCKAGANEVDGVLMLYFLPMLGMSMGT